MTRPLVWGGWVLALALMAPLLWVSGCGRSEPAANRKPVIVVTIPPLASLTSYLVADWAEIHTLLPPGASPHGFELTPTQLRLISEADVLVMVGMNLDPWAERAAHDAGRGGLPILRFSDLVGITKPQDHAGHDEHDHADHAGHDHAPAPAAATAPAAADEHAGHNHGPGEACHDHSGPNAHLWVDPVLAAKFLAALTPKLEALFLDRSQSLRMRSIMAQDQINKLDAQFRQRLSGVPVKELVTFHNAFDLLAERYGLKVVAHLTEIDLAPGGEVAPRQLIETIEAVRKHNLKVIYAEPQFPDAAMRAVQQETGAKVLRLDAHGHPGIEGHMDYLKLMESNLRVLVEGQSLAGGGAITAPAAAKADHDHDHDHNHAPAKAPASSP